jgi:hypothetical protein
MLLVLRKNQESFLIHWVSWNRKVVINRCLLYLSIINPLRGSRFCCTVVSTIMLPL